MSSEVVPVPQTFVTRFCSRCGQNFKSTGTGHRFPDCLQSKPVNTHLAGTPLTPRELQIIRLVALALANKEIAFQLHLSEGTVKENLSVIFKKVGVKNRTALALLFNTRAIELKQRPAA